MAKDVARVFRDRVKAVELEAERLQQEAMTELGRSGRMGRDAASPAEAARASIAAYQVCAAAVSAEARETSLPPSWRFANSQPPV